MRTVNMHEAKTHLSRLVEAAANGEPFIIARAGKPVVKVIAVDAPAPAARRTGFLAGEISVPQDFDRMGADAIEHGYGPVDDQLPNPRRVQSSAVPKISRSTSRRYSKMRSTSGRTSKRSARRPPQTAYCTWSLARV